MTALERLPLSRIFQSERDGQAWYFFDEDNPSTMIRTTRAELAEALALSADHDSTAHRYVTKKLAAVSAEADEIDLDVSDTSFEFFLQDIVKRSPTLAYISVVAAFTCSRMRPNGFGGMAILITADAICGKSTNDLIAEFLSDAGFDSDGAEI